MSDPWHVKPQPAKLSGRPRWAVYDAHATAIACDLSERDAKRIVRDHNRMAALEKAARDLIKSSPDFCEPLSDRKMVPVDLGAFYLLSKVVKATEA